MLEVEAFPCQGTEWLGEDYTKKLKTSQNEQVEEVLKNSHYTTTVVSKEVLQTPLVSETTGNQTDGDLIIHGGINPICLNAVLADSLRPHQIEGLRFLWRETLSGQVGNQGNEGGVQAGGLQAVGTEGGGALLAHTMGLGKTVTVIAFLFTLAEAQGPRPLRTANPSLPRNLRVGRYMPRVLILAPAGLLTNWALELETWADKFPDASSCGKRLLKTVYRMNDVVHLSQRIEVLNRWRATGGILLLGQERFRSLVDPKDTTHRDNNQQSEIHSCLLSPGPEVVIADEAHAFKNIQSKITRAVKKIDTPIRIALTASPLSNSLIEFYSLMKWVSPESDLGETVAEFRCTYYNPIMNNLSIKEIDSDFDSLESDSESDGQGDVEEANRALRGIISATQAKMHRRNVDTIKQYLKPKTEFIIRIPLTDKQVTIYNNYLQESADDKSSAIWRLFCLRALCNHPEVFSTVLRRGIGKRREEQGCTVRSKKSKKVKNTEMNELTLPNTESVEDAQEMGMALEAVVFKPLICTERKDGNDENSAILIKDSYQAENSEPKFYSKAPGASVSLTKGLTPTKSRSAVAASNKFLILFNLLDEFKAAGDKALLFSHSIDTLDYIWQLAIALGFSVLRLDGSVQFQQRQEDLVRFNRGAYDIYLVSTKAGGVGLNLQCANRVVILDNDHSPAWEQQAIGRSYRMGQKKEVFVYRFLVEGSVETKIAREKRKKLRLSDVVIDGIWEERKIFGADTDHRNVWQPAGKVEAPAVVGNATAWRSRDPVLDKVVSRYIRRSHTFPFNLLFINRFL